MRIASLFAFVHASSPFLHPDAGALRQDKGHQVPLWTSVSSSYRCDHRQLRVRVTAISAQRFCVS